MKHILSLIFIAGSFLLMTAASCKKTLVNPIDRLPAATQEGKDTFGCLINGKIFLPKRALFGNPAIECHYYSNGKSYNFNLSADNYDSLTGVTLYADSMRIEEGVTYDLKPYERGVPSAKYTIIGGSKVYINTFKISSIAGGKLKITRFDLSKNIVSGTFWFDAVNDLGEKVEVREGRFDVKL